MSVFRIVHPIGHIRQPNPNDCWAAAVAMARGSYHGQQLMVWNVKQLAAAAGVNLNADGSLPENDLANVNRLASAVGLRTTDVRTTPVTLAVMRRLLTPGRMAILGGFNYSTRPSALNHAVTFYRLWGDDATGTATLSLVDPYDGRAVNFSWDVFDNEIMADPHFVLHF
jgi:hypothetical protein